MNLIYKDKQLIFLSLFIYITSILVGIGYLNISQGNLLIAISIFIIYFFQGIKNEFYILDIFIIILNTIVIVFTKQVNLIFPSLLWMYNGIVRRSRINLCSLKLILKFSVFFYIFIIISYYFFGFKLDKNIEMWRLTKIISRNSLGFTHPNVAMLSSLSLLFYYLCILTEKKDFRIDKLIIPLIFLIILYSLTLSRTTSIAVLMLFLLLLFRNKYFFCNKYLLNNFVILLFILFFLISISLLLIPSNSYFDELLSGRITLYKSFFSTTGFTLFGNSTLEEAMFDNGYLQMLLSKGIIYTAFFIIVVIGILKKRINYTESSSWILIIFFTVAITETTLSKMELWIPLIILLNLNLKSEEKYCNRMVGVNNGK